MKDDLFGIHMGLLLSGVLPDHLLCPGSCLNSPEQLLWNTRVFTFPNALIKVYTCVCIHVSDGIERNLCPLSLFTLLVFIVQFCHFLNMKHYLGKVNKLGASQVFQNLGNWLILIFKYWYCKTFFWLCLTTSIIFVSRPTKKKFFILFLSPNVIIKIPKYFYGHFAWS